MNSKKYSNTKLLLSISESILTFILLFIFVKTGLSYSLENFLVGYSQNEYFLFLLYVITTGLCFAILFSPFSFYGGFILEHKYKLSNQTFLQWIWEGTKGVLISLVIGLPILLFFFYMLRKFGENWWLPFAVFLFVVSVVLARIVPVFILPMFYKIIPIDNEELKARIARLAEIANIKVENVFTFNMSKTTKKANAAFTGLGKSKRVLLGDTLLENYSLDEVETVLAHEFGHYKKKHIIKNILLGTFFSFFTLFLIAKLYSFSLPYFHVEKLTQIYALPILALWGMLVSLLIQPLSNIISRKYEYEADAFAIETTGKHEAFLNTLDKLTEQNLGDKEPHPFVEWFFYSHPSINKRKSAILSFVKNNVEKI
ncbi:MAG: M48 family metallopeptidase [Ignavibacteriaceae bacterium]|jgi:STE24 endopeptidase|nr:M48 family metallopeptidase [Ignavibacteriaceae bacterium]